MLINILIFFLLFLDGYYICLFLFLLISKISRFHSFLSCLQALQCPVHQTHPMCSVLHLKFYPYTYNTYMRACVCVHMHVHTYTQIHGHNLRCTIKFIFIYIIIYNKMCFCIHVCVCTKIYKYINTTSASLVKLMIIWSPNWPFCTR